MASWQVSRMAGWQDGRMAGWQDGRMAGWQDARWQDGIKGRIVVLYRRREGTDYSTAQVYDTIWFAGWSLCGAKRLDHHPGVPSHRQSQANHCLEEKGTEWHQ
jgi:hypothetical protein